MNKSIRGPVINGDGSGERLEAIGSGGELREAAAFAAAASPAPTAAAAGLAAAVANVTAEHKAAAAAPKPTASAGAPVQPAFEAPADDPAIARDDNHGRGGQYHIVDGVRVRVEPRDK